MTRSIRERESRDNEGYSTRDSELRIHSMIEEYSMDYLSPLHIPHEIKKEGFSYYWASLEVGGKMTNDVNDLLRKGWTLVPAERSPNFAHDPLGRNPHNGKYICIKDMILMERPEVYLKKEREFFHRSNNSRMRSLQGVRDSYANMRNVNYGGMPQTSGFTNYNRISSF